MNHRRSALVVVAVGLGLGLVLAAPMLAQDPKKQGGTDEMMQAMEKAAAVGPHHEHLKALAGKWSIQGKIRMSPDGPWQEHKSDCVAEPVLGGRFVEQRYKGTPLFGSTPFEGIGFLGYDNDKQKFVSVWLDNMGTMIMTAEGTSDPSGKTFTFRSNDFTCPGTGQKTYLKSVYQIESKDRFVLRMSSPGPDGQEFVGIELVHTRTST